MQSMSEGSASQPVTAGAMLRNARQQRGLHIAALAVMLKVPQAKLESLEGDRYDELPDATFARALATAMCRALKVDAAPVLALLPRVNSSEFDVRPGLNQPFRERGGAVDGGILALLARPVVWGPALLLLAAAAVYWIPAGWLPAGDAGTATVAAPAFPPAVSGAASAPAEFVAAPAAQPASGLVAAAAPVAPASAPAPASVLTPASAVAPGVAPVATPGAAPAVVAQPAPAPVVPAAQALRISATSQTWVEVVDAQGQTLLSRVLGAGEQQVFGGAAPYKVRIGNVSGTRIEWRGAALDLSARSKDNIARLELN
ncbi:helix-turn-helix domain-containing protein [Roseateles sp. DC23W]|uniref:Helix-turn-helix domain-containing protein n=1 Tax=Pelomonas dachongensis TaxID=3299029 RepID=A0ABW7EMI9_9BURK